MRAAYILHEEKNIETRIINMHTVKPIDVAAITAAVKDIGLILTAEEHQTGGFGGIVATHATREKSLSDPLKIDMIGVDDRFGQSAPPWQLMRTFGLSAEHIAQRSIEMIESS